MKRRFFWLTPWLSWTLRATPALVLSATIMPVVAQTTSQQAIRLNNDALREHYRGNYAAALQLYNAAIASADGNKWFFFNRAATQLELENFDDALKDLSRALSLGIDEDRVESQRSRVFLGKGDLKTALATSNRAISLNPGSGFSYNNRGLIHFTARRFPQAIADFNRAVELGLTGPEVLINRSTALRLNKQFADALADATEALAIAPDYEAAYLERARIYLAQKQTRKALSDLDKAIRMNPRNSDAYALRATIYQDAKDYDRAIADFDKASKLAPQDLDLLIAGLNVHADRFYAGYESLGTASIAAGEIKLEGRVTRVDATSFSMLASAFTNAAGNRGELSPPKAKTIAVPASAQWLNRANTPVTLGDLRPGVSVAVIGRDNGKTLVPSRILLAFNTASPPTVPQGVIGRPRFVLPDKRTVRAGTAFVAQLADTRKMLITARHLLGPDGGLKTKLSDEEIAAIQSVAIFDYDGKTERTVAEKLVAFTKPTDKKDDSFFDALAFEVPADTPALPVAMELPTVGEPVWIAGQTVEATGNTTQLYPATVMGATAIEIVVRVEPSIRLRALSGAPVVNREGRVVGIVLSSRGALTLLNPAATIATRLTP